jgi:putative ABC transport system permease protein
MRAVVRAGWAAVRRRRLQSLVIAVVVLLSSATAVVALGLLVASSAPFDRAFTRQQGAHATASFDATKVRGADLAATTGRPGVTATAGPFAAVRAQLVSGSLPLPTGLVVGRADAGGTVDRLNLTDGRWLTGPGQIVLSRDLVDEVGAPLPLGSRVTVEVAGNPSLQLVGIADSVTGTAEAWVWPAQTNVLHANGAAASQQLLYRFAAAGSDQAIRASLQQATAGLPEGALTGASSYLTAKLQAEDSIAPMVPFVVAFAVLGLLLSVLIVVNVVAGAVVAGFRTIGVHKALGFTPGQVVGTYAAQILAVCLPACVLGVGLGRLLAVPLLAETARAYGVSVPAMIPAWADLLVLAGVPAIVGLAAVGPAARAGRLSAVGAITVGRAPAAAAASACGAPLPPPGCPGRSASGWAARRPGRPVPRRPSWRCCWGRPRWCWPPGWRRRCRGWRPPSAGRPPCRSRSSLPCR